MKRFIPFLLLFVNITFGQTENDLLTKFHQDFEKYNNYVLQHENDVENSVLYFEHLISKTTDTYLKNALQLYKAKEERRIEPKKALATLDKVKLYLENNKKYEQLLMFYNTIYGRIVFETQQNCKLANTIYIENIKLLQTIKKPYEGWNIIFETKTGIINTLLCLQKDQEALEYLKQLENEINPKTQLKEYLYVLSVSGYIHTKFANYKEGENYFKKVINLLENSKDHLDNYLAACNNLGHIYKVTDNVEAGIEIMEKALSKAKQINDTNSLLLIENNLGFLYIKKERYSEAEKLGLDVVKQANQKQFEIHHANGNRLLGTVYYYLGDYKKSEVYIDQSIAFYRDFKNIELLRQSLDIKNKLLIKTEQFESAEKINSEIISLLDSVSLNSNVQNLQKNLVAYETEKKDNEIIILKQKDEISNFKIEKQKQHITSLFIAILIIGVFSLIIFLYQKKINTIQNLSLRSKLTRSQFNPHYINNAFTSLQATLVENDLDEKLIDYTSNISRFSRLLLESTFKDEWSLFEEKQMMENYLKTQLHRYEGNFKYAFTNTFSDNELRNYKIPSALTQTVLENAIEHGGYQNNENGIIEIMIDKNSNNELIIKIKNNIVGEDLKSTKKAENEPSRGLEITKQRMDLHSKIHKLPTHFDFTKNENVACITFTLPLLNL
jgi:tetratricopeptide (TPR) repeat protein